MCHCAMDGTGCGCGNETNQCVRIAVVDKISIRRTLLPHHPKCHIQLPSLCRAHATSGEVQPYKVGDADDFQLETVW
jgi:hypothetical protein